jgi:NitT/TauT family transport system substrate-binding protein
MKQSRQRFLISAGVGAASAAVPGIALGQARTTVRMAGVFSDSFGQPFFVKDSGAFARRGFDVEVSNMVNVGAVLAAMSGGSLELGVADVILGVKAILAGAPVVMIAASGMYLSSEPSTILAVAASSPIRGAKDLIGKTVGVPTLGALTSSSLLAWLPQNGVEPAQVKFVEVPQSIAVPSLERGTIDCVTLGEPFITPNKSKIRDIGHPYDAIAKEFPISVWYGAKAWIDADPARARNVVAAIYDNARWDNTHRAETAAILVRDAKFDPDSLKGIIRTTFATSLAPAQVQQMLDFATQHKLYDRKVEAAAIMPKL